jgi:phage shock protein A
MEDFETKLEKYMARAAKCEEQAREATDKTRQDFYEVLARYFRHLAEDFKQVIEKRKTA